MFTLEGLDGFINVIVLLGAFLGFYVPDNRPLQASTEVRHRCKPETTTDTARHEGSP